MNKRLRFFEPYNDDSIDIDAIAHLFMSRLHCSYFEFLKLDIETREKLLKMEQQVIEQQNK